MITAKNRAMICDLGISKFENIQTTYLIGTKPYFTPQMIQANMEAKKHVAYKEDDIYAFGYIALELSLGHFAYSSQNDEEIKKHKHDDALLKNNFPSGIVLPPRLPWKTLLESVFLYDPEKRFSSSFFFFLLLFSFSFFFFSFFFFFFFLFCF